MFGSILYQDIIFHDCDFSCFSSDPPHICWVSTLKLGYDYLLHPVQFIILSLPSNQSRLYCHIADIFATWRTRAKL